MDNPVMSNQCRDTMLDVQARIAPWCKPHKVNILVQDSADIRFHVNEAIDKVTGVLCLVAVTAYRGYPPAAELDIGIICTEAVAINRSTSAWVSALDAAQQIGAILGGPVYRVIGIEHDSPEKGVLEATLTVRTLVRSVEENKE